VCLIGPIVPQLHQFDEKDLNASVASASQLFAVSDSCHAPHHTRSTLFEMYTNLPSIANPQALTVPSHQRIDRDVTQVKNMDDEKYGRVPITLDLEGVGGKKMTFDGRTWASEVSGRRCLL
jgi:hypothetical protein